MAKTSRYTVTRRPKPLATKVGVSKDGKRTH